MPCTAFNNANPIKGKTAQFVRHVTPQWPFHSVATVVAINTHNLTPLLLLLPAVPSLTAAGAVQAPTCSTPQQAAGQSSSDQSPFAPEAVLFWSSGAGMQQSTGHSCSQSAVARQGTNPAPVSGQHVHAMRDSISETSLEVSCFVVKPKGSVTGSVIWQCRVTPAWHPYALLPWILSYP